MNGSGKTHEERKMNTIPCRVEMQKVEFDLTDPKYTKVKVKAKWWGSCPKNIKGEYKKHFPATVSPLQVLQAIEEGKENYAEW